MWKGILAFVLFTLLSVCATAQEVAASFDELRVSGLAKPGDSVYVTDNGGRRTKGTITDLAKSSLTLSLGDSRTRDFSEKAVRKVERRDSLMNGALIGIAAGVGLAVVSPLVNCDLPDPECVATTVIPLLIPAIPGGAVLGAVVDASVRRTVYIAPGGNRSAQVGLSPLRARDRTGVLFSVRF